MTQYYVKIDGSTISGVKNLWSHRAITNRSGQFEIEIIDPTNTVYDAVSSGDSVVIYRTSDDEVMYGGYVEKKKRDGGNKYNLKINGGDWLTKANQIKVDALIYRKREFGVIFRNIAHKYICTTLLIDDMDVTTDWVAASDFGTLTADAADDANDNPYARLGDACLKLEATYSAGSGTLTKTMAGTNTINADDYFGVYVYIADTADLGTNIALHLGQDSSNYYSVDVATSTMADGWNYVMFDMADKTTGAGSPTLTSVDYYQIETDLVAGVSGEVMRFDELRRIENDFLPTGINITTDYVEYMEFKNTSVFNMWKKVADLKENIYDFYIDKDKGIFFGTFGTVDSGVNLARGTNIIDLDVWDDDQHLVNFVEVYGKRQVLSWEQTFDGTGSQATFTLTYRPVDTYIEVGGTKQLGYKEGLTSTDFDYTVDQEASTVTFRSGKEPGSGTDNVYVRYAYSVPVRVQSDDSDSIESYGHRGEKIENDNLATRDDCLTFAQEYIDKHKDPVKNGIVKCKIVPTVDVGETVDITHSLFFDSTTTFTVAAIKNYYIGTRSRSEITLSNIRQDIEQYLTSLLIRMNAVEEKEKGTTDLKTKAKSFFDTLVFDDDPSSNLDIRTRTPYLSTWYFGTDTTTLFSTPIVFAGGSGQWGSNLVVNPHG